MLHFPTEPLHAAVSATDDSSHRSLTQHRARQPNGGTALHCTARAGARPLGGPASRPRGFLNELRLSRSQPRNTDAASTPLALFFLSNSHVLGLRRTHTPSHPLFDRCRRKCLRGRLGIRCHSVDSRQPLQRFPTTLLHSSCLLIPSPFSLPHAVVLAASSRVQTFAQRKGYVVNIRAALCPLLLTHYGLLSNLSAHPRHHPTRYSIVHGPPANVLFAADNSLLAHVATPPPPDDQPSPRTSSR